MPNSHYAFITKIEYHLPEGVLSTRELSAAFPEWDVEKIESKTGITERRIASEGECASDLGVIAAQKLFDTGACLPGDIDYLLFCTQSPDYFLPTTACLMQDRLGIPTTAGALDFNLGCSGFVYGLGLAKGLVESGQARNVLLVVGETYSKFMHPRDKSVRTLFGDAAAAILIQDLPGDGEGIGPFVYGTDGRGGPNLIVPAGAARQPRTAETAEAREDENGNWRSQDNLFMAGPEILTFTLAAVPKAVCDILALSGMTLDTIDLVVFHQANRYMLDQLRRKTKIPAEKFFISLDDCGNTVSATIPIALQRAFRAGTIRPGQTALLVGFGVGYSWGATLVRCPAGV